MSGPCPSEAAHGGPRESLGEAAVPAAALNREELLRDSEATLREVALILGDLWDTQRGEPTRTSPSEVIDRILTHTHREVEALKEGIGALHGLLPDAISQTDCRRYGGPGLDTDTGDKARRASEILLEVQARLDLLSEGIEDQGLGMA